jgi:uncharacterized membrane protein
MSGELPGEDATMTTVTDDDFAPADELPDDEFAVDRHDPDAPATTAWRRRTAIEMVVSGVIGLFTSFVLSIEAWQIAKNPDVDLNCDISAVLSCKTVAQSWQAELLGFPNAFLGIAFEVVVITLSVAVIGGVRFPRWFMLGTQALYTIALLFAYWLFQQSYFEIGVLCPWCLLITVTTTLVWAGLTRLNVREGYLPLPAGVKRWAREFVSSGNDWFITIAVIVVLGAMILLKYGNALLG